MDGKRIRLLYELEIEIPGAMAGTEVAMKLEDLFGVAAEAVGKPIESLMLMVSGVSEDSVEGEMEALRERIREMGLDD